jgi:hypothetical protein
MDTPKVVIHVMHYRYPHFAEPEESFSVDAARNALKYHDIGIPRNLHLSEPVICVSDQFKETLTSAAKQGKAYIVTLVSQVLRGPADAVRAGTDVVGGEADNLH